MLNEILDVLTTQMIKDNFQSRGNKEDHFIITKQQLYEFCIKLIKVVIEIYDERNDK